MKVDAHQHFWRYDAAEYGWITDSLAALRRDFLPADLAREQAAVGFDGSIAVQARQTLAETEWLLGIAEEHPRVLGIVGWVDLCSREVEQQLARFAAHPRFCGVRHVVQDEPDHAFLLRADFQRGLAELARHGLAYDLLIYPRHLRVACELVARFPEQRFVLDHLGKPAIREGVLEPWARDLRALARHPNVWCKASGMVTEADWERWRREDLRPYLDVAFEAFGPARIMIGSDWPVCTVAGSYAQVLGVVTDYVGALSPCEQAAVLGDSAARCYRVAR